MDKLAKLRAEKHKIEKELREEFFRLNNDKKNRSKYIIPIQIFKLQIKIKDKKIEIENLENKIQQLKCKFQ
ncbi:hypothetical protein [Flavobacterium sp. I3-2]|uniref:hypothetical protein n=1 Tax=Flavobacterium sp. I3-2 TaxID=2748319 RepID=UPI0015AA8D01|nr:hypothetical protein [Flavobacterium sp. I3-2]